MRILVTGGTGFLGRHVVRALETRGHDLHIPQHSSWFDLCDQDDVRWSIKVFDPEVVIHCAALVGGIGANQARPAEFFYDNLMMGAQLMHEAYRAGVQKFVNIGSVCMYPEVPPRIPFVEDDLWAGYPEPTNAPYGVAKRALLTMAQAYRQQYGFNAITLIPTNLYGPGDSFDPERSHVIPALIRKFVEAKENGDREVVVWGTGNATREFLYVEDAAEAICRAATGYDSGEPMNLGSGDEVSIFDLADTIADVVGYAYRITFDSSKPDGQPRRLVDSRRAAIFMGWSATTDLYTGLQRTVDWYLANRT